MSKPLTYMSYLQVDELLQLQHPKSDPIEHDEMLFIIIHQVYELWFKQMLHELDYLAERLRDNDTPAAQHTLRRVLTILKTVVAQVDVLETMTPLEFNSFRSFLESASGFQSVQFRLMEFSMGHKRETMLKHFDDVESHREDLQRRFESPTLWDAFLAYLHTRGHAVPDDQLKRDVTQSVKANADIQKMLIDVYRNDKEAAQLCETLIDFDEGLQEWRYRHVKMVERTIGRKKGTGGSSGVDYLTATIRPIFPDLWEIRSLL